MKAYQYVFALILIVNLISLVSCQQQNAENASQEIQPPESQSNDDMVSIAVETINVEETRISNEPTIQITPTNFRFSELPIFPDGSLHADAIDVQCSPLCWYDIQIGVSNQQAVRSLIANEFESTSSIPIFYYDTPLPAETEWFGYAWQTEESRYVPVVLEFGFRDDTLLYIFSSEVTAGIQPPTPQEILVEFGRPDFIYIYRVGGPLLEFDLIMGYYSGLLTEFRTDVEVSDVVDGIAKYDFCLDNLEEFVLNLSMGEPFETAESLPEPYNRYHGDLLGKASTIDDVADMSTDEIMQTVDMGESACLEIQLELTD